MIQPNSVICGDCLEVMKDIPDKSIDMIQAEWDKMKLYIEEYLI